MGRIFLIFLKIESQYYLYARLNRLDELGSLSSDILQGFVVDLAFPF